MAKVKSKMIGMRFSVDGLKILDALVAIDKNKNGTATRRSVFERLVREEMQREEDVAKI